MLGLTMSDMLRGRHGHSECDGKGSGYCAHSYRTDSKREAAREIADELSPRLYMDDIEDDFYDADFSDVDTMSCGCCDCCGCECYDFEPMRVERL
jgi:hypothetical protein